MSMSPDDITKYKSLYLQTSWGYLNMLRKNVAFLQKGVQVENSLDAAHLAAHSLKSQSILMSYNQIGKFAEELEKIFKVTIESKISIDDGTFKVMLSGLNKVQQSLTQISEQGNEADMSEEIGALQILLNE